MIPRAAKEKPKSGSTYFATAPTLLSRDRQGAVTSSSAIDILKPVTLKAASSGCVTINANGLAIAIRTALQTVAKGSYLRRFESHNSRI